jgi:hypothetical protein
LKRDTVRPQDKLDAALIKEAFRLGVRKYRSIEEAWKARQEWVRSQLRQPDALGGESSGSHSSLDSNG